MSNRLISIITTRKLMRKRCKACLDFVKDVTKICTKLINILIVEYLDVFPDQFPGLFIS